jgi:hypothetical protein
MLSRCDVNFRVKGQKKNSQKTNYLSIAKQTNNKINNCSRSCLTTTKLFNQKIRINKKIKRLNSYNFWFDFNEIVFNKWRLI